MQTDQAWNAVVEFAASRHGVFHTTEAARFTVPARRIRRASERGVVTQLYPKVFRFAWAKPTIHQRMVAATLAVPGSAVCGMSAAALHGLTDLHPNKPVDLWVPHNRSRALTGALMHRSTRVTKADVLQVEGVPAVSAAVALCQVGKVAPDTTIDRCLDEFQRRFSMRWLEETMDRCRAPGPGGTAALDRILNSTMRVPGATDSWFERMVTYAMSIPDLPPIELQCEVVVDGKTYYVDTGIPILRYGVEAHSRRFHFGVIKADEDNFRDLKISSAGWLLSYITHSQITQAPEEFALLFAKTARMRAKQLGIDLT